MSTHLNKLVAARALAAARYEESHVARRLADDLYRGLLDSTYRRLLNESHDEDSVHESLDDLFLALQQRKSSSSAAEWHALVQFCRSHPLKDLLHEDPFTCRAFRKPRGYAGDAVLLDYIYGREEKWPPPHATSVGRRVFDYTTEAPAAEGVRARRGFIANLIDRFAEQVHKPSVLSIAAGHLREAELTAAIKRRKIGRYVALDADARSLREVQRCYGSYGVETAHARFRKLLTNKLRLGRFDLVYTTGLFDYVVQSTGQRLVQVMFETLNPGGRLVVANFLPGIRDVGYMEVYMDWQLIYRTRHEMVELTMEIPQEEIREIQLFAEENQNILFLQVTRS